MRGTFCLTILDLLVGLIEKEVVEFVCKKYWIDDPMFEGKIIGNIDGNNTTCKVLYNYMDSSFS